MAFDTSLLDRVLEERRAEWERRRQAMLAQVLAVLDAVAPKYGVSEAYIFGSLAKPGRYHDQSDIDVAVKWTDQKDFFGLAGDVSGKLGQDIDILPLDEIPFADAIRREGILWTSGTSQS
jgi:predicted nucleotidyltransferase